MTHEVSSLILSCPYQPGQRTFSDIQTQGNVSQNLIAKSHLGREQLKCDFSLRQNSTLFQGLVGFFLDGKEKNDVKTSVHTGLATQ